MFKFAIAFEMIFCFSILSPINKFIDVELIYQVSATINRIDFERNSEEIYFVTPYPPDTASTPVYLKGEVGTTIHLNINSVVIPNFHLAAKLSIGSKQILNMKDWRCCVKIMELDITYDRLGMTSIGKTSDQQNYICSYLIKLDLYCIKYNTDDIYQGNFDYTQEPTRPIIYAFQGRNETMDLPIIFQIPTDAVLQFHTLSKNLKIYDENGEIGAGVNSPLYYLGSYGINLGNDGFISNYSVSLNGKEECKYFTFEVFNCYKTCNSCDRKKNVPTDAKHQCTECFKLYRPDPNVPGNCILPPETVELFNLMSVFEDAGIDIYNPEDPFFSTRCIQLPFPSEADIPKKDRIKKYLFFNSTFCSDSCHFVSLDKNTKEAQCDCTKAPLEKNSNVTVNGIKENILATLFDANYDVIFCYMLVFDSQIFPKNIGSWIMIGVSIGTLGNIIYSFMKSMKILTETVEGMCNIPIDNNIPINNDISKQKQQKQSQKLVDSLVLTSVRQQMTHQNAIKKDNQNKVKPSPPPRKDQQTNSFESQHMNRNNQCGSLFQKQGQSLIHDQSSSSSKFKKNQYNMPEGDNEISMYQNKGKYYQSINTKKTKQSPMIMNESSEKLKEKHSIVPLQNLSNLKKQLHQYQSNIKQKYNTQIEKSSYENSKANQQQPFNSINSSLFNQQQVNLNLNQPFTQQKQQSNLKQPITQQQHNNKFNQFPSSNPPNASNIPITTSKTVTSRKDCQLHSIKNVVPSNRSPTKKLSSNAENIAIISQNQMKSKQNNKSIKQNRSPRTIKTQKKHSDTDDNTSVDYDEMDFDDMITKDQRHFCLIYWFYLKSVHPVLDSFIISDPTFPKPIKISLFIMELLLDLFLTAFFYSDKYISNNYNNPDSVNFFYDLPVSIFTYLVTSVMKVLFGVLSNTERELKKIENCSTPDDKLEQSKKFLKYYNIRLMIFNILQIVLILFFWYYIAAFCAVYPNSQNEYLNSDGTSLGISMLMPFAICLVLTGIHMLIIKYKKKWLYLVLSVLTWLC